MEHRTIAAILVMACLPFASVARIAEASAAPKNLLPNESFEQDKKGQPIGWQIKKWSGEGVLQHADIGHTGRRSVMIASEKGADFAWMTTLAVEPYASYRLSGWVKTEDVRPVKGRGALIGLPDIPGAVTRALTSTHDWTHVEIAFETSGQDSIRVTCTLGGWDLVAGKAWYDDVRLEQLARFDLDYAHLFRPTPPNAPRIGFCPGYTAIVAHPFHGGKPRLLAGKKPMHWRLVGGPEGMTVDARTGAASWHDPVDGYHLVVIEASNRAGKDILEFVLIVVPDDIPGGQIVATKHIDFVLPPEGVRWFMTWKPHAMITAQYEAMRKIVGHEPARGGKQVVKYQPDMGGGVSGNPVLVGPGFWENWDEVRGWRIGVWHHEVGHNFHFQAPITFYSDIEGFDGMYHHHLPLLNQAVAVRTWSDPKAFGLSDQAAAKYRRWWESSFLDALPDYRKWLNSGGKARGYKGAYDVWWIVVRDLCSRHGPEMLEKTIRAMRTDGVPRSVRETAKTPLQVNALFFCIMSHAANTDLRPHFDKLGLEYDGDYYRSVNMEVGEIVRALPHEDGPGGWKKCPINGHYYRRTMIDRHWHGAEAEARQFGGHLATVRSAKELEWLQSRFAIYPEMWIGLQAASQERKWQWISGEDAPFTNWGGGRPRSTRDSAFALLRTESGKWVPAKSPAGRYPGIVEVLKPDPAFDESLLAEASSAPSAPSKVSGKARGKRAALHAMEKHFQERGYEFGWAGGAANEGDDTQVRYFKVTDFSMTGNQLELKYDWHNGVLSGTLKGNTFRGTWNQDDGGKGGVELIFSPDVRAARGWWDTDADHTKHKAVLRTPSP